MSSELKHGTRNLYENYGCRCSKCRVANADYRRERRLVSSAVMMADPTDPKHGTVNGYANYGCRCERCRKANAQEQRRRRQARARGGVSEEYVALLRAGQDGKCAACGEDLGSGEHYLPEGDTYSEGLLCSPCHRIAVVLSGASVDEALRRLGGLSAIYRGTSPVAPASVAPAATDQGGAPGGGLDIDDTPFF